MPHSRDRPFSFAALPLIAVVALALAVPAVGQETISQEVVQPLPSEASQELSRALSRLARNSRNLDALIAAGTASLELGDVDAAVGFFGRAADLAPNDPRIKAGKGAALVRNRRPVEALKLFQEAEAAGVEIVRLAGDYGLAYDLVGDNRAAQARYRRALARSNTDEVTRRLALSQAIGGDSRGFEATLRPLLAQRDFAAYRTRAFGLAILGRDDDAVAITEAVMPRAMATRMEPYLRFMPRLTKAQQAAAANLGIYPTASAIGRDDPRIAALAGTASPAGSGRAPGAGLEPQGTPLGTRSAAAGSPAAGSAATVAATSREEAERTVRVARREAAADPLSRTRNRPRIVEAQAQAKPETGDPAPTPAVGQAIMQVDAQAVPVAAQDTEPALAAASGARAPELASSTLPGIAPATVPVSGQVPAQGAIEEVPVAQSAAASEAVVVATLDDSATAPGFDLASTPSVATDPVAQPAPTQGSAPATTPSVTTAPAAISSTSTAASAGVRPEMEQTPKPSVADAFADFASSPIGGAATPSAGAVDISSIEVRRDVEEDEPAEPAAPAHPSRFWVQIATGKDRSALRFDWRRLDRKADGLLEGKGPFVTAWGQTNRLLAGPYDSRREARNALNALSEKGFDAFTFTSPEGQEVDALR